MNPPLRRMKDSMREQRKLLILLNIRRDGLKKSWNDAADLRRRNDIGVDGKVVKAKIKDIENYLQLCNTAMMKGKATDYPKLADFHYYKENLRAK
jgi:hypothetical protein|tara:strand:+ start:1216 stop:1500 length:285 start_codon:yes stop_codon:yes gene_type:complete